MTTETPKLPTIEQSRIIAAVQNGDLDPYVVRAWLRHLEGTIEVVKPDCDAKIVDDMTKNGLKEWSANGFRYELKDYLGAKYDYAKSGHPTYDRLSAQKVEIETELKATTDMLRTITKPMTVVDESTGEIVTVTPPPKSGKTGIVMTAQK